MAANLNVFKMLEKKLYLMQIKDFFRGKFIGCYGKSDKKAKNLTLWAI